MIPFVIVQVIHCFRFSFAATLESILDSTVGASACSPNRRTYLPPLPSRPLSLGSTLRTYVLRSRRGTRILVGHATLEYRFPSYKESRHVDFRRLYVLFCLVQYPPDRKR